VVKRAVLLGAGILIVACLAYFAVQRRWARPLAASPIHRLEHVVGFGILGLVLLPLGRSRLEKLLIAVTIFAFGFGLELLQYFVFHYSYSKQPLEWWDVRDNAVGLMLALLAVGFTRLRTALTIRRN
jgi:hypothetical protein